METQVRTPHAIFNMPQRLVVPLFQRPYVWNLDSQWEPLWEDVVRVSDRLLRHSGGQPLQPHFLGAVVLQQLQIPIGRMPARTIIDGQQRLTTLQLLFDALHAELLAVGADLPATRLEDLVVNPSAYRVNAEDQFKVWPTNRDRPAFNAVMGATPPVNYDALGHPGERIVDAHRYFGTQAREWLMVDGPDGVQARAVAMKTAVREHLQMVVIDLTATENAQEIFETLNARGAPLTAADLIKNFVFQRLAEANAAVDTAYQSYWKEFESGFWETEISVGRVRYPRSSIFLNHWLIARTGKEVVAREVFDDFKRFSFDTTLPMQELLQQIHRASHVYRLFVESMKPAGPIDRIGLFAYRTGVLESEVIKPFILWLLDPEMEAIAPDQVAKALDSVESWMVRRMLVRATTKNYSQAIAVLISENGKGDRALAGDLTEAFLRNQTSDSRYWPDDAEVRTELEALPAYRRLRRGRLRMVLEAVEDHLRGWRHEAPGLGDERVARGRLHIEHIMPRKWQSNWPLHPDAGGETERDYRVHTLGNLTLLPSKLNSKLSNGPWTGTDGKRETLEKHDVFFINREMLKTGKDSWTDESIQRRTKELIETILHIWPAPPGHKSAFTRAKPRLRPKIQLADLINAGALSPGIALFPRRQKYREREATLLPDGSIELEGVVYASPTDAATKIVGKRTGGWAFFMADPVSKRTLRKVRTEYIAAMDADQEDEDVEDDDDEDEAEA